MSEADDETTTRHPADNDFDPLTAALESWFGKSFSELPAELRQLVDKHFLIPWDNLSAAQQRSTAQQRDIQHHPGLALERHALWKKSLEVDECERTGLNIPTEDKTDTDLELHETRLRKRRKEEAAAEAVLQQKAQSLGLGWPDAALAPEPDGAITVTATQRQASETTIRDEVTAAYRYAKAKGMKPPNTKQMGDFVQPILAVKGLKASKEQISTIASEACFKGERLLNGVKSTFPPFCSESFQKSRTES